MIRVMHLIVGLNTGGAEANLHRLVKTMDRSRFENVVVSILTPGPLRQAIEGSGVRVLSLNLAQGVPNPLAIIRLARLIRTWKPDLLQTWMYHADLLGGFTAKLCLGPPVIWNIRNGDATLSPGIMTRAVAWLCARLSSWLPARIVSCSNAGRDVHLRIGYARPRMIVIVNGYDTDYFRPDSSAREKLRSELGVGAGTKLIVNIARYHPMKDHSCFLEAARLLRDSDKETHFVLCGDNVTWQNTKLVAEIERLGLREYVSLLGRRSDINLIMAAASVVVSSSCSEGFPNVVAESMACGAICVGTDVGDTRDIIGEAGFLVPPYRPGELAAGVRRALFSIGMASGRERIIRRFSLQSTIDKYEQLYEETVAISLRNKDVAAS